MKIQRTIVILVALAGFSACGWGQNAFGQQTMAYEDIAIASPPSGEKPSLTRFDLNFPGGSPRGLVQAVEKASGKPLNLVIPIGSATTELPPLKMRGVTVPELFHALQMASQNTSSSAPRLYGNRAMSGINALFYTFQTADKVPNDSSVWSFSSQSQEEPRAARFWQLSPYLNDYTVDDITTAIETGYKMLGDSPPAINFHKDTRLLIAVGEQGKLGLIDAVLEQLSPKGPPPAEGSGEQTGKGRTRPPPMPTAKP